MWDKPRQVMTSTEYEAISADGAPPGVYAPNMSREDAYTWRAKKIGGKNPRVEIRKTVSGPDPTGGPTPGWASPGYVHGCFAQLLIVVMADGRVRMSQNGPAVYGEGEWAELTSAVREAREALA